MTTRSRQQRQGADNNDQRTRMRDNDGRDRMNEGTTVRMRTRGKGQQSRRAMMAPQARALNLPSLASFARGGGTLVLFYFLRFYFYFLLHSLYNIHILLQSCLIRALVLRSGMTNDIA
jgi:hypothetical protein